MKKIMNDYLEILNDFIRLEKPKKGNDKVSVKYLDPTLIELKTNVESFWSSNIDRMSSELTNKKGLNTYYENQQPDYEKMFRRLFLYTDRIILTDPFSYYLNSVTQTSSRELIYLVNKMLAKYLLFFNQVMDWIDEELVIMVPSFALTNKLNGDLILKLAESDFNNNNIRKIANDFWRNVKKNYGTWFENAQMMVHKEGYLNVHERLVKGSCHQINDILCTTGKYSSIPLFDENFLWDLFYCKTGSEEIKYGKDFISLASLKSANVYFLDNVTLEFAKKIRDEGYLSELRTFFRESYNEIQMVKDKSEFDTLVDNYSLEIIDSVKIHEHEWKRMRNEEIKKLGIKTSLAITSGTIASAATFGLTVPMWIGIMGGALGAFCIRDIIDNIIKRN